MFCKNPVCKGEREFEHTERESGFLLEFGIDPESMVFCRQCREMRRLAVRNERNFFKGKCAESGKEIWSVFESRSPYRVFDKDVWWGDSWDGLSFGRDFDFSRPFFQQFHELLLDVPRPSFIQRKNQNADFTNDANSNNDSYMIFTSDDNVNCHYGSYINCRDSMDCEEVYGCEMCYDCLYCKDSQYMIGDEYCVNSSNCYFSSNLVNCHNCIFSFGLRDRKNCIFNTEVSPDVFQTFIMQRQLFRRKSYKKAKEMFEMFLETTPQRYMYLLKTEDSTGDRLVNCKECENTYSAENCVNCCNCSSSALDLRDCMDCWAAAYGMQKCYEIQTCLRGGFDFVGNFSNDCSNCFYIDNCQNCQDCFGCVGLKNKKFCIFNKEYSPEDYEVLKVKIMEHMKHPPSGCAVEWGQFFPIWMSPFAYNITFAQVYFGLDVEEYKQFLLKNEELWPPGPKYKREHLWLMFQPKENSNEASMAVVPPDSLYEAKNDDVLNATFYDFELKEPFKIMGRELALYQRLKLPLPDQSFKSRYTKRLGRYNSRKLYKRKCQKCAVPFQTTFAPDSPYIIFCEKCFQQSLQ